MPYLLDSDWVIDHLSNLRQAVQLVDRLAPAGLAMSVVSYMEAYQGIGRNADPAKADAALREFVDLVPILPFTPAVARRCGSVREELRNQGKRINSRALDLMVAATALEGNLTLVTCNKRDYRDIPGLTLYEAG